MKAGIHKDMAFQMLSDYPNKFLVEFLLEGTSKPEWRKDEKIKMQWLKEWMDMPDNKKHSSKQKNDHSYKILKTPKGFQIKFAKTGGDQATVVARLKYSARDIAEWKVEEEFRVSALELAKSIHWVIDLSSPPHTVADWDDKFHAKVETDFDKVWKKFYELEKGKIKYKRKDQIKDIYRWAKAFIEDRYQRNCDLLDIYKSGGSIISGNGEKFGRDVIFDISQNMADYLAYIDKKIDYEKMLASLKKEYGE